MSDKTMVKENLKSGSKDRTLAVVTHFIGIFSNIFGALLIFFMTKDKEIKKHSRNALNWQLSLVFYSMIIFFIALIISIIRDGLFNFRFNTPFPEIFTAFTIVNIILCIIASVKANDGKLWEYPLTIDILLMFGDKNVDKGEKEFKKVINKIRKK